MILLFLSCMMIPFQVTIIPAYLITKKMALLNSYLGMALPVCSTIICIFVFKASFEAIPSPLATRPGSTACRNGKSSCASSFPSPSPPSPPM